jgi:hypothetical protein
MWRRHLAGGFLFSDFHKATSRRRDAATQTAAQHLSSQK